MPEFFKYGGCCLWYAFHSYPDQIEALKRLGERGTSPMTAAVLSSLTNTSTSVSFDCRSGNCTWPGFTTLGICSSCEDVSSRLERHCDNKTVDLNDKNSLLAVDGFCSYKTPFGTDLWLGYYELRYLDSSQNSTTTSQSYTLWNSTYPQSLEHLFGEELPIIGKFSSIRAPNDWVKNNCRCNETLSIPSCEPVQPQAYDCSLS